MRTAERTMTFGIVAGLVVSQANLALFDDLVHRQASFDAVGWANWFLFLFVPVLAGGMLLYHGRIEPEPSGSGGATGGDTERSRLRPERALAASLAALAAATVVLRLAVPAILHAGNALPSRLPRTLSDGFSFVAQYARLAPLAGQGHGYDVATAAVSAAIMAAAVAFGAMAFERRLLPVLASATVGVGWSLVGWYVPGGAGSRIIGSLWPVIVLGSVGLVLGLLQDRPE